MHPEQCPLYLTHDTQTVFLYSEEALFILCLYLFIFFIKSLFVVIVKYTK